MGKLLNVDFRLYCIKLETV